MRLSAQAGACMSARASMHCGSAGAVSHGHGHAWSRRARFCGSRRAHFCGSGQARTVVAWMDVLRQRDCDGRKILLAIKHRERQVVDAWLED
jgi:hypothetical protein